MSTQEALQEYDNCAAKIFSSKNRKRWSATERFRATALQEAVKGILKQRGLQETEPMWEKSAPQKGKAVVAVMPADQLASPRLIRSWRPNASRQDDLWDRDITIWEAARATTAAPSFFKPQKLGQGPNAQLYVDAALGVNNPIKQLLDEAEKEFGTSRRLGLILSIGTGTRKTELSPPDRGLLKNWIRGPSFYINLVKTMKDKTTDSEAPHGDLEARLGQYSGLYFRFSVPGAAEQVKLHHYKRMSSLKSLTQRYLQDESVSRNINRAAEFLATNIFCHGLYLGHTGMSQRNILSHSTIQKRKLTTNSRTKEGVEFFCD